MIDNGRKKTQDTIFFILYTNKTHKIININ